MKRLINNLIERLTTARESEIIIGDMCEEYERRSKTSGKRYADVCYVFDFLSLLTNRALRNDSYSSANFFIMVSNYIKVAFRQIARQKLHNTINIAGLAIGLSVTFLISLYVVKELSYDKFHEKADRIYLLPMTWTFGGTQLSTAGSTSGGGPLMKELFNKEIETYVRIMNTGWNVDRDGVPVEEKDLIVADSTFFDVFTFPLIIGNPKEALNKPFSLVLTEKSATRYFGEDWRNKDVLSKVIAPRYGTPFKITAVAKDPPVESHLYFDMIASMSSLPKSMTEPAWNTSNMTTYVVLDPHASATEIVAQIPGRIAKTSYAHQNAYMELDLVSLTDIYLHNQKYAGFTHISDIRYVYIFAAIAGLVLIIAIINYMNLSTARSMERAKEVGVRKVVGAVRVELFWQFISESILVSFAAVVLAVIITYLLLPVFNSISGKVLDIDFAKQPGWIGVLIGAWMLISFLGGVYPAMVLSSYRPVSVLKGKLANFGSGALLRKSLVVFQFAVSIFLIVCTLTISDQLSYMVNKKLGVDKEKLIAVPTDSISEANMSAIQTRLATVAGIEETTTVSSMPVNIQAQSTVTDGDLGNDQLLIYNIGVGPDFVRTTGLEIISGADLSKEVPKDGRWEYLINESAVKLFGWTNENAVGKRMKLWQVNGVVKGVVRDFHFSPLHKPIEPLIIHAGIWTKGFVNGLLIRIQGDDFEAITSAIHDTWREVAPASPFALTFVDQNYQNLYKSETRLSSIMNVFSALAILIAGLGLFGLASYTIMRRMKELGIRKVLGASLSHLLLDVSGRFVKLVLIAFTLAAPSSWLVMENWLDNFAYPTSFSLLLVVGAGGLALLIATATILYHAIQAVRVNPANILRTE